MSYTTPPSPRWNDTSINYPNVCGAPDHESCISWREEIEDHVLYLKKNCRCKFGECMYGRTSLSKTQRKLGIVVGESLCGRTYLQHFVEEKRDNLDNESWDDINEWYYESSDEEEDEDLIEMLELEKDNEGNLTFNDKYLNTLQNIELIMT